MGRSVHDNRLYNDERKNEFLRRIDDAEKEIFRRIFKISFEFENDIKMELHDFTSKELKKVYIKLGPSSIGAALSNLSNLKTYLQWAINKSYRYNNINPIDELTVNEKKIWREEALSKSKQEYITEDLIIKIEEDEFINKQDAVILRLFFEGLSINEIRNLRKEDIDEPNRMLKVNNNKNKIRTIEVSEKCIEVLKDAIRQNLYKVYKSENSKGGGRREELTLFDKGYVIKTTDISGNYKITNQGVYARISKIKEHINISSLKTNMVARSGMLKLAKEILDSFDHKLNNNEFREYVYKPICNKFGRDIKTYYSTLFYNINYKEIESIYGKFIFNKCVTRKVLNKNSSFNLSQKLFIGNKIWWKDRQVRGMRGEKIVMMYLQNQCSILGGSIIKVPDYAGYDFKYSNGNTESYIEVKTIINKQSRLCLTKNELHTSNILHENYYIYILNWNGGTKKDKLNIYVIKNPLKFLGISEEVLRTWNNSEICSYKVGEIDVYIKKDIYEILDRLQINFTNKMKEEIAKISF